MQVKKKAAIVFIVLAAAALALFLPALQDPVSSDERTSEDVNVKEEAGNVEPAGAVFKAGEEPFRQVLTALEKGRPVLIKFYARW